MLIKSINPTSTQVAEEEIVDLPHFMTECSTVYVPQIGYMLSVQPWTEEELTHEQLLRLEEEADLRFMFVAGGVPHFKVPSVLRWVTSASNISATASTLDSSVHRDGRHAGRYRDCHRRCGVCSDAPVQSLTSCVVAEHETAVMVRLTSLILASADKLLNLCKKVL